MKKTLLTTCREQKSTRREGGGVNLRTGKLKRIKTQVMSRHPWHSGKRAALEYPRPGFDSQRVPFFLFVPLPPFFYAAIAKCWKVQRSNSLRR